MIHGRLWGSWRQQVGMLRSPRASWTACRSVSAKRRGAPTITFLQTTAYAYPPDSARHARGTPAHMLPDCNSLPMGYTCLGTTAGRGAHGYGVRCKLRGINRARRTVGVESKQSAAKGRGEYLPRPISCRRHRVTAAASPRHHRRRRPCACASARRRRPQPPPCRVGGRPCEVCKRV